MTRVGHPSRRQWGALLLVVCVICGGLGATTGAVTRATLAGNGISPETLFGETAVAENSSIHREGGVLNVSIPRNSVDTDSIVEVTVKTEKMKEIKQFSGGADETWVTRERVSPQGYRYVVNLSVLVDDIAGADLKTTSVLVTVDEEEVVRSNSEDLRYFEFNRGGSAAEFDGNGTLQIAASNAVGFRSGGTVPVEIEDEMVEATVRTDGMGESGDAVIKIPWKELSSLDVQTRVARRSARVSSPLTGTVAEYTLEHLSFHGNRLSFSSEGQLQIPVRTVGVRNGTTVQVTTDTSDESLEGTIGVNEAGRTVLRIPVARLGAGRDASELGTVTFRADLSGDTSRTVALLQQARERASMETTDSGIRVHQPLIINDEYSVKVTTTAPSGTYATTVSGNGGVLTIDHPVLLSADKINVSVYRDGETFVAVEKDLEAPEKVDAYLNSTDNRTVYGIDRVNSSTVVSRVYVSVKSPDSSGDGSDGISRRHQALNGTVEDGNLTLAAPLPGDDSYRLLVVLEDKSVIRAVVVPDGRTRSGGGDKSGGVTLLLDILGMLVLLTMLGLLGYIYVTQRAEGSLLDTTSLPVIGRSQKGNTGATKGGGSGLGVPEPTVEIALRDPVTNTRIDVDERVHLRRVDRPGTQQPASTQGTGRGGRATHRRHEPNNQQQARRESRRVSLRDGYAKVNLPKGRWEMALGGRFETATMASIDEDTQVVLDPDPRALSVRLDDTTTSELVGSAQVTVTPDIGESRSRRAESSPVTIRLSPRARRAEVTVAHDRYDRTTEQVVLERGGTQQVTLSLSPKTGNVTPTVSVDGRPVSGVQVEARAVDQFARQHQRRPGTGVTDEQGRTRLQDCIAGEYEVKPILGEGGLFTIPAKRVTVEPGSTSNVRVDVSFEFRLSGRQRERLEQMEERLSNLTAVTGRDTAIPGYYQSVGEKLLETIQGVPELGYLFATSEIAPTRLVDALLDQAKALLELVDTAMSSKRNTDLFTAGRDLPAHKGGWSSEYDPVRLFELWRYDREEKRRLLAGRLETVEERIRSEQAELSSVAPAREPWELVRDHVNEERFDDGVRATVLVFVYEGLLDAIDRLFDDEELRERLERTVF